MNTFPDSPPPVQVEPPRLLGGVVETLDLRRYIRVLRQYKWSIVGIGLLFALLGAAISFLMTPKYRAQVDLLADPTQASVADNGQPVSTAMVWLFYETQKDILGSRRVALSVVDKLDLVERDKAERAKEHASALDLLKKWLDFDWTLWLPDAWRERLNAQREHSEAKAGDPRLVIADRLRKRLDITTEKNSQIISVAYLDKDPRLAADVANAVADAYVEFGLASRLETIKQQTGWLNEQLADLKEKLRRSEAELQKYQREQGLIDSENQQKLISTELGSLSEELVRAQTKRSEAEVRYRQVEKIRRKGGDVGTLASVLHSPLITRLKTKQSELYRKVSELSERYGKKHPKMIAAKSELREATRVLNRAIDKVVGGLKQEYEIARANERRIRGMMAARKKTIRNIKGKSFDLTRYEREVENDRLVYESFLNKFKEMDVSGSYDGSNIKIVDRAIVPRKRYSPKRAWMTLGFLAAGLLFGTIVAFLRDRLDSRFTLLEQAEESLDLPGLGVVPTVKRRRRDPDVGVWYRANPGSPFAEAINHIRTGVLFSNIDSPPRILMVTSALPGEGKTTLANNLALAFAQLDETLLIECDLRRPRARDLHDLDTETGLTDLLRDPESRDLAIHKPYEDTAFHVLPAGEKVPNPLELLSSDAFAQLLLQLREGYAHIVLDAPPVLPVSDGVVLGHRADGVLMAIRAQDTTEKAARDALRRLRGAHIQPLGVVLTQAQAKKMAYYGSQYYTDYSYYGDKAYY